MAVSQIVQLGISREIFARIRSVEMVIENHKFYPNLHSKVVTDIMVSKIVQWWNLTNPKCKNGHGKKSQILPQFAFKSSHRYHGFRNCPVIKLLENLDRGNCHGKLLIWSWKSHGISFSGNPDFTKKSWYRSDQGRDSLFSAIRCYPVWFRIWHQICCWIEY